MAITARNLTKAERQAKEELEADGWTVIRNGWPDFLCYRTDPETDELTIRPIETKGPTVGRQLHGNQNEVAGLLAKAGLPVVVYKPGDLTVLYSMLPVGERIKRGLEKARENGRFPGRPKRVFDLEAVKRDRQSGMSYRAVAKKHQCSVGTIYQALRDEKIREEARAGR
jgi:hypothetical protein